MAAGTDADGLVWEPLIILLLLWPALLMLLLVVVAADAEGAVEGDVGELVEEVQFSAAPPHDDESSFVAAAGGGEEFELSVVAPPEGDFWLVRSLVASGVVDVAPGAVGVEGEAKSSLDAEEPPPPFDIRSPVAFPPFGVAQGDDGPFVVGTFESSITDTPPPPLPLPFASITDDDAVVAAEEEEVVEPPPAPAVAAVDDGGLFSSISIVVSGPVPREHW